ncbi:MAG TPA: glycerol kinase GlpK [Candidatus Eisenbacteria bacterium]|nr:glycerol kinase GlpK [Candidatus Eisenbacteria bacterium]
MSAHDGERVLAIDQGTTGTTALLLDRNGRVTGRGYAELPQHFPRPGWVEHDGDEIWGACLHAIAGALESDRAARIAAIGVTNQRETTLVWDRATSKPIAPAIVWQDRRTAERCDALRRAGKERAIARRTGLRLDPYFSGTKLEWILAHGKGARARARRGDLAFGTIDAWVLWKLTGGAVHATDPTNASRTLLYDIHRHRWDDELLALFGVAPALLPEVRPSSSEFGRTRGVPGLPDGVPIAGIAGDQQAALFGQGCVSAGGLKNTYGTGCFLMLHTGRRAAPPRGGLLTTVACGPRGEAAYALEGSVFIAGAAVQWLRDGLGIIATAAETESLARSVPDAAGTYLVPAFAGLGAPWWRPEARGIWCGLTRGTTRAHLVRAALEAIAFQTCDLVDAMGAVAPSKIARMRVDGGATANDFLMQLQADLLGITVERPKVLETTALGAAHLAGIAIGWWDRGGAIGGPDDAMTTFRPALARRERERLRNGWREAVSMLLRVPARPARRARPPASRANRSRKR